MPQLLAFLPCENVIVSQDHNLSLIEVLNRVTAEIKVPVQQLKPDAGAPHRWFVVAMWHVVPEDQEAAFEQRIALVDPSGKIRVEAFGELAFGPQKPIHRMVGEMTGFPVSPQGTYSLELYIRKQGEEVWNETPVCSYPFVIAVREELSDINTRSSIAPTAEIEQNAL